MPGTMCTLHTGPDERVKDQRQTFERYEMLWMPLLTVDFRLPSPQCEDDDDDDANGAFGQSTSSPHRMQNRKSRKVATTKQRLTPAYAQRST